MVVRVFFKAPLHQAVKTQLPHCIAYDPTTGDRASTVNKTSFTTASIFSDLKIFRTYNHELFMYSVSTYHDMQCRSEQRETRSNKCFAQKVKKLFLACFSHQSHDPRCQQHMFPCPLHPLNVFNNNGAGSSRLPTVRRSPLHSCKNIKHAHSDWQNTEAIHHSAVERQGHKSRHPACKAVTRVRATKFLPRLLRRSFVTSQVACPPQAMPPAMHCNLR